MNENSGTVTLPDGKQDSKSVCTCVLKVANVLQVPASDENVYQFAAKTLATETLTLISVKITDKSAKITVNCEKMVICAMLLKDVKNSLSEK